MLFPNISPITTLLALLASAALPIGLNLWWWRRDRRKAESLAAEALLPAPSLGQGPWPRVSFLVPAWNEAGTIERCLQGVNQLSYPSLEVVLCAGGEDGTYALAARQNSERTQVIEQQLGEGKQHALQRCFEASSGEIIYLLDGDCVITDETVSQCLAPILCEHEAVVTGSFYRPLPEQIGNPFVIAQLARPAYAAAARPRYTTGLLGGNCVICREALTQAGAFANAVGTGTDYDLAQRLLAAGVRIRYVTQASIASEFPTTSGAYFRQQARWIRSVVLLGLHYRAYGDVLASLRTSSTGLAMLAGLALAIGLALWYGLTHVLALTAVAIWLALFVAALAGRLRQQRFTEIWLGLLAPRQPVWRVPGWVVLDFVAWSLPLLEYPFRSLRDRW